MFDLIDTDGEFRKLKSDYLEEYNCSNMHTRMSCRHTDNDTREGFGFARLIVATYVPLWYMSIL